MAEIRKFRQATRGTLPNLPVTSTANQRQPDPAGQELPPPLRTIARRKPRAIKALARLMNSLTQRVG